MKKKNIKFGEENKDVNLYDLTEADLLAELERFVRLSLKDSKLYVGLQNHIEWLDDWRNETKSKNNP